MTHLCVWCALWLLALVPLAAAGQCSASLTSRTHGTTDCAHEPHSLATAGPELVCHLSLCPLTPHLVLSFCLLVAFCLSLACVLCFVCLLLFGLPCRQSAV